MPVSEMRIACRSPVPPVPEQLADQGQVLARHNGVTGGGVAKVVQARPTELHIRADRAPAVRENPNRPAFSMPMKQMALGIARSGQHVDERPSGLATRHRAGQSWYPENEYAAFILDTLTRNPSSAGGTIGKRRRNGFARVA